MEVDAVLVATGRSPYTEGLNVENALNVELQRGFIPVNEKMQVMDKDGKVVEGMWCIGDANGKMMLAPPRAPKVLRDREHDGSRTRAQPQLCSGRVLHPPQVSFVGLTEEQARAKGEEEGFEVAVRKTSFKANSKALAEKEGDGMAKLIYNPATGEILGMWIFGLHAADLIRGPTPSTRRHAQRFEVHRARSPDAF